MKSFVICIIISRADKRAIIVWDASSEWQASGISKGVLTPIKFKCAFPVGIVDIAEFLTWAGIFGTLYYGFVALVFELKIALHAPWSAQVSLNLFTFHC